MNPVPVNSCLPAVGAEAPRTKPSWQLPLTPLRFELSTAGPFHGPEYKGALFRGGFGKYFREMACVTRAPSCEGCPHRSQCSYSVVFESPVDTERAEVLRKYPNAPHPFVLTPPLAPEARFGAGSAMELEVTLVGRGRRFLPHFVAVFEAMGRSGRFGGRYRVDRVAGAAGCVYDGRSRKLVGEAAELGLDFESRADGARTRGRLRIEFVTPVRMRTEGRYNLRPSFVELTQALVRRLHLLRALYGDGETGMEWTRGLLRSADGMREVGREWRVYEWGRTSGRTGRRVEMDGVVGQVEVEGELGGLVDLWRAGEWVHVGNGTSMGLGKPTVQMTA